MSVVSHLDDQRHRRRLLSEALIRSRDVEKAIIAHDDREDAERTERLAAQLASVNRPR